MSVVQYWKERLEAQNPLYDTALRIPQVNVRPNPGMDPRASWPRAVARSALYQDYITWFKECYLKPFKETPYYAERPSRLPKPVSELIFFSTIAPWIYVVGKKEQARTYLVPTQMKFEDRWVSGKKNSYFARLLEWRHHVAAFELDTGIQVEGSPVEPGEHIPMLADIRANYLALVSANRGILDPGIGVESHEEA